MHNNAHDPRMEIDASEGFIPEDPPSPNEMVSEARLASTLTAVLFWGLFLFGSAMYAVFALSPSLVSLCRVDQQWKELESQKSEQVLEVAHLDRVASALRADPDFVHRLADREFGPIHRQGTGRFEVSEDLGFDARVPRLPAVVTPPAIANWSERVPVEVVEIFVSNSRFRSRWGVATAGVLFFAFVFCNSGFASGALGRGMVLGLVAIAKRYRLSP